MPPDIELVVFDLGRVLIRICDDWEHACRVAGLSLPNGLPKLDPATLETFDALAAQYDTGVIDLNTFAARVAPLFRLPVDDVVRVNVCYLRDAYPGVPQLLDDLAASGVRTACLSNTTDPHWRLMLDPATPHYLPLERLTYRFPSHLVGLRKPDDAIYAHVERESGVEGERILFFDDVPENVEAARRRGWHGHRIDPKPDDPISQIRTVLRGYGLL